MYTIEFKFEGKTYETDGRFFDTNMVRLPDGRVLENEGGGWLESVPPQLAGPLKDLGDIDTNECAYAQDKNRIAAFVSFEGKTYAVPPTALEKNRGRLPDGRAVEFNDIWLESLPIQGGVKQVVQDDSELAKLAYWEPGGSFG
jgi:hypothetical protein